ncbi:3949_t:CDS:2, partial [Gigaspora margarita]
TQEDFKKFKTKITHINWQFEASKDERLHSQVYVQLKIHMMMKAIKELLNDYSIFIEEIKTKSLSASRWGKEELSEEITRPFEFGKFCEIEKHTKKSLRSKDYKNKEFESIIEGNKMLMEGVYPLEVFKHNAEKVRYSHNYVNMKKIYEDLQ